MIVRFLLTAGISFVSVYAVLHAQSFTASNHPPSSAAQRSDARRLLLIGNSRTYYHDMPALLAKIAESSNPATRFAITVRAWGGASLEENCRDGQTQHLMTRKWDNVIIQAESRAQSGQNYKESFFHGAADLSSAAKKAQNTASFIVNYAYDKALYPEDPGVSRRGHYAEIIQDFSALKKRYDADLIPVAEAWEILLSRHPQFALYEDGNHPTLHGSFFQALVIFAHLTHSNVATVTYHPPGIKQVDLDLMKSVIKEMSDRKSI